MFQADRLRRMRGVTEEEEEKRKMSEHQSVEDLDDG